MKYVIVLVVIVVAAFWFLGRQTTNQAPAPEPAEASSAVQVPTAGAQGRSRATPAPRKADDRRAAYARQAKASGVQLRQYQAEANGAVITIAWTGDVATLGGDYLQACLREGLMRDFDLPGEQSVNYENGQRVWMGRYRVKF